MIQEQMLLYKLKRYNEQVRRLEMSKAIWNFYSALTMAMVYLEDSQAFKIDERKLYLRFLLYSELNVMPLQINSKRYVILNRLIHEDIRYINRAITLMKKDKEELEGHLGTLRKRGTVGVAVYEYTLPAGVTS